MPLNLSNRDQNSGHLFYNRRLRAAITRFSVRMRHDDRKQQAAVALAMVFVFIGVGWMTLLHLMKPAGLIGRSALAGNRDTGQIYARINDRLYPALNLTSARLAVGNAATPTWVTGAEIAKYPAGPLIGIPGIPDALTAAPAQRSAWAVCDTANSRGTPAVTAVAGDLTATERGGPLGPDRAILATHRDATYLIWANRRARIDPTDRTITFTLGVDPAATHPVEISTALFDAIPAVEPIAVPPIPDADAPSSWLPGSRIGDVLETRDSAGSVTGVYVLLGGGVQRVSGFVADLLRAARPQRTVTPRLVSPDTVVAIPVVDVLNVEHYPTGRLQFVDSSADPVTCLAWTKHVGDPQAAVVVFSGRGLPVTGEAESAAVPLVRDDRGPDSVEADRALILPRAATFVATTSGLATATSRESLFWLSPQGVRYGVEADQSTLRALGLDPTQAVQAPWPLLRTFAAGPAISRDAALVARDTVPGAAAAVPQGG
ncbi:type VII secretion protein EccB [Mycolicibacillus trivialis]